MESYQLKSKVIEDGKEFLIQTVKDTANGIIKTNLFKNGELLDASYMPLTDDVGDKEILDMVKNAHREKKEELERLLKNYNEAMQTGKPRLMFHLGTALYYKKMYSEAYRLLETTVKLKENFHEALFYLCQVSLELGNVDDAVGYGEKAVALREDFADYHNYLGEAFLAGKSCKRAMIEFEQAVDRNIYYADAYFNMGLTHILNAIVKEDYEMSSDLRLRCQDLFKKAALIQPDYTRDPYYEGIEAINGADFRRAFALLKKVRDDIRDRQRQQKAAYFSRFQILTDWEAGDSVRERIAFLEKEIDKNPNYVDLYYDLGLSYLAQARHDWKAALENFEKALEINKEFKKARRAVDLGQEHFLKLTDVVTDISDTSES
jgi:tetratricopeptide (TPR) repeat protein